jgi:hypothetical protein
MRWLVGLALISCLMATCLQTPAIAQSQLDRQGEAPANPYSASDVWGQFHRNGYAQAATPLRGPEAGDRIEMQSVRLPGRGGTPTQMHISGAYPDGSRTAWSTTLTHLVKLRVKDDLFELADAYEINPRARDWNIIWNMTLAKDNKAFVPSPKTRQILRFGEADPADPSSDIILEAAFDLPEEIKGAATVLNLTYDGWLVFVTTEAWIGAVRLDFSDWRALDLGKATGDITTHNSFPVDEEGNIFIASFYAMTKVHWTGDGFELVWRAPYDFRGPGCKPPSENAGREVWKVVSGQSCTGSGTTPTLVGRDGMDELVVAVDSHRQNNLVAFWRNDPPADWKGLTGQDRQVASVLKLPNSTWAGRGFTAENSPPVAGYDIAVAQYAGFTPNCRAPRGVQLARWSPERRRLELVWANPDVPFNNVMTISTSSGLIYGSGRDADCQFVYRGIDRATGAERWRFRLGKSKDFADGGNTNAVLPDRSLVFGVPNGVIRLRPAID